MTRLTFILLFFIGPVILLGQDSISLGSSDTSNLVTADSLGNFDTADAEVTAIESDFWKGEFVHFPKMGEEKHVVRPWSWMFIVLLVCLALIAASKLTTGLEAFWQGFTNLNLFLQFYRDRILGQSISSYLLTINFYLAFSILLFFLLRKLELFQTQSGLTLYLLILFSIIIFDNARLWLMLLFGLVFSFSEYLGFHVFNTRFICRFLGISILPLVLALLFGTVSLETPVLIIGLCISGLFFIYGVIRSLTVTSPAIQGSWFHFILYICTLEIAPFMLLIRLVYLESV
jgi:hypothetical protein